ncbi:hypothetical protein [Variovorax sp. J22R115]|uniref:hypothetical protein n=1 Tax=Variovorax sp. J22R115 TaxID=3053509 RepID=UPI00257519FF|nr:hypothetical protein [Variovorax sp. J22R115]MDM0052227.1 hypothetical protein [Variovorax sp. J22R115]
MILPDLPVTGGQCVSQCFFALVGDGERLCGPMDLPAARDFLDRRNHRGDQAGCLQNAQFVDLRGCIDRARQSLLGNLLKEFQWHPKSPCIVRISFEDYFSLQNGHPSTLAQMHARIQATTTWGS